jgi:hypothetical protein
MLWQMLSSFQLYRLSQRGRTQCCEIEPCLSEAYHSVKIWVVCKANQIGPLLKRKFEHRRNPHVLNANHHKYPPICAPVFDYPIVWSRPKPMTNNFTNKNCMQPMRRLNMAQIYFLGLQGVKVKEGFFIFLFFPKCS